MLSDIKFKKQKYEIYPYDSYGIEQFFMIEKPNGEVLKVSESAKKILDLIDGNTTMRTLQSDIEEILDMSIDLETLHQILTYFMKNNLINDALINVPIPGSNRESKEVKRQKRKKLKLKFSFYLPIFKEKTCRTIGKCFSFLYSKYLFMILLLSTLTINILAITFQEPASETSIIGWLLYFILLYFSGIFHEFGHIAASVRHNVVPKNAGIGMFLFFPVFYTDLNRVWRLNRLQRSQVDIGGLYFQLLFSGVVVLLNCFFPIISIKSFVSFTLISILLNLFPLVKWDGYWLLNDLLGINNLNQKAMGFIKAVFRIKSADFIRKDWKSGLNSKQKIIIPIYAIALLVYFLFIIYNLSSIILLGILFEILLSILLSFISLDIFGALMEIINNISYIIILIFICVLIKQIITTIYRKLIKRGVKHYSRKEKKNVIAN